MDLGEEVEVLEVERTPEIEPIEVDPIEKEIPDPIPEYEPEEEEVGV